MNPTDKRGDNWDNTGSCLRFHFFFFCAIRTFRLVNETQYVLIFPFQA